MIISLIGVVMWTSAQLTWDCTIVDRSRDPSEMGLIEKLQQRRDDGSVSREFESDQAGARRGVASLFLPAAGKSPPGSTVLYFAVVALPVFGFGQWFVAEASRGWIFLLFAMYLGSSLGLLLITSLLGLERYLGRKNLHVPDGVARNWIIVGSLFIGLVMLCILIVPRPAGINSLDRLVAFISSPQRTSTKMAGGRDGQPGQENADRQMVNDDGGPGQENADRQMVNDDGGPEMASDGEPKKGSAPNDQGEASGAGNRSDNQRPSPEDENSGRQENVDQPADARQGDQQPDRQPAAAEQARPQGDPGQGRPPDKAEARPDQRNRQARQGKGNRRPKATPADASPPRLNRLSQSMRPLLYLMGLGAALLLLWMFRHEIAAWLGRRGDRRQRKQGGATEPPGVALPSFASFRDPFASKQAPGMTPSQLASYSMAALDALARDLNIDREKDQTPTEFARRWETIDSELSAHARRLADLYGRCAYGPDNVRTEDTEPLVALWRSMRSTFQRARSAVNSRRSS